MYITKIYQTRQSSHLEWPIDNKTSPNAQGPYSDTMHEINITKEGITRLLKNLASSKASGTDMISARFLKETADEVAKGLVFLMSGEKQ